MTAEPVDAGPAPEPRRRVRSDAVRGGDLLVRAPALWPQNVLIRRSRPDERTETGAGWQVVEYVGEGEHLCRPDELVEVERPRYAVDATVARALATIAGSHAGAARMAAAAAWDFSRTDVRWARDRLDAGDVVECRRILGRLAALVDLVDELHNAAAARPLFDDAAPPC